MNNEIHADTGQESVADYAFLASPAHQQVVLGANPGYVYEIDIGKGYGSNPLAQGVTLFHTEPLASANTAVEKPRAPEDSYYFLYSLSHHGIQFDKSRGGRQTSDLLHHRPVEAVRDNFLSGLELDAWKLGSKDLETIFNYYYYGEFEERAEVAATRARLDPDELSFPLNNDGLHHQC